MTWTTPAALPNADPNDNIFPKLLQLQNGTTWMVWEKITPTASGEIYLMTNNGYGWGGETVLINSNYDDIAPSIAQLNNGTIMLVFSRGNTGDLNSYNIYTESYTNNKWSSIVPLVTVSPSNFDAVLYKMTDGSIWMVWSRATAADGNGDLYYKIFKNGAWTAETAIPTASTSTYEEKLPGITQAANGIIMVTYESNAQGTAQIYTTSYNGAAWTPAVRLTSTTNTDKWPSIGEDRNGSLWLFWARELPNGTTPPPNPVPQYQWDIFYRMSTNNGTSWTQETDITNNAATDEQHPTIYQGPDKKLWMIYDSCCNSSGNPYGNPNLFIMKSGIIPAHDVAVSTITTSPSPNPRLGENVNFTVTVQDLGDYVETPTVSFYVNSTLIGTKSLTVSPGGYTTIVFVWSSASHNVGKYPTRVTVGQVPGEMVTQNNSLNSTFLITFKGDVNRDGIVNIADLTTIAAHFGAKIGAINYSADADLNKDGVVNIVDLTLCSADFGKSIS